MKHIYILISMLLVTLLASCGTPVEPVTSGTGTDDTLQEEANVEISTEEEELISQLINEVIDSEDEEETPALDLTTTSFVGNGTEPFWGFSASGSTLILKEPSDSGPMNQTTFSGVTMTNVGTSVNMTAPGMTLDLTLEACSDGMSEIAYTYSSSFVAGTTSYTGCAYTQ